MEELYYDIVIVGSGPSGLAMAQCCTHLDKKILIIDKEDDIGGCHRVRRVKAMDEELFTEHGPRVYSHTYIVFIELLKEMGVNFDDLFTKYDFNITQIGGSTIFSTLSYFELTKLFSQFIMLLFNDDYGKNILLSDFIKNFNVESIEMINRTCILVDGSDSTNFTLNKFLQLVNQQYFYSLYQPKLPNDKGLFKIWKKFLVDKGVKFLLNSEVTNISINNNVIEYIIINNIKIYSDKFIFAIPPKNLNKLISNNKIPNNWGDFNKFALDTQYYDYISLTFHWNTKLNLKKVYGFPYSDWGIAFIKLSDYMKIDEKNSQTLLSIALTRCENKSRNINKTVHECNFNEIVNEIYLELKKIYGDEFIFPTIALLSPGIKYIDNKYVSIDTAFINSYKHEYLPFNNKFIKNMYNLGTHNGKSLYKFTSLESAVTNGVMLSKFIYPEINYINIKNKLTVSQIIKIILLVLSAFIIMYLILNGKYYIR